MSVSLVPRSAVLSQTSWTTGPGGQPYYFNVYTSESTYVRPLPTFPTLNSAVATSAPAQKPAKDKPLVKTPIPGTDWTRVKTTQGNTFYSHKVEKRSVWTVPDEIKEALEALGKEEQDAAERLIREQEEAAARIEIDRVKAQIAKDTAKRKAQDPVPVDEVVISKKARVDDEPEDEEMDDEDEDSDDDDEEEEEWQKEAAAQLAAEAEEHERQKKEEEEAEQKRIKDEETLKEEYKTQQLNMPAKVDLAPEEAKALFKVHRPPPRFLPFLTHRFPDATEGEGYQSAPSLGQIPPFIHLRPSLRAPFFCLRTTRSVR